MQQCSDSENAGRGQGQQCSPKLLGLLDALIPGSDLSLVPIHELVALQDGSQALRLGIALHQSKTQVCQEGHVPQLAGSRYIIHLNALADLHKQDQCNLCHAHVFAASDMSSEIILQEHEAKVVRTAISPL